MGRRAFLSSTSSDLERERAAAADAIRELGWECVRMEDFGAGDSAPLEACLAAVAGCDVLVLIAGHRYGSSPPGATVSFTEAEYEAAAGIGRLVFLLPDDAPLPASLIEEDALRARQRAFRKKLGDERLVAQFTTPDQLARSVAIALSKWSEKQQRAVFSTAPASSGRGAGAVPVGSDDRDARVTLTFSAHGSVAVRAEKGAPRDVALPPVASLEGPDALGAWVETILREVAVIDRLCRLGPRSKLWLCVESDRPEILALPWHGMRCRERSVTLEQPEVFVSVRDTFHPLQRVEFTRPDGRLLILGEDRAHAHAIQKIAHEAGWATWIVTRLDAARRVLADGGYRVIYAHGRLVAPAPHADPGHGPCLELSGGAIELTHAIGGDSPPTLVVVDGFGERFRPGALASMLERASVAVGNTRAVSAAGPWAARLLEAVLAKQVHPVRAAFEASRTLDGTRAAPEVWARYDEWIANARIYYVPRGSSRSRVLGHAVQLDREKQWRKMMSLSSDRSQVVLGFGSAKQSVARFSERIKLELELGEPREVDCCDDHQTLLDRLGRELAIPGERATSVEVLRRALVFRRVDVFLTARGTLQVTRDGPTRETARALAEVVSVLQSGELAGAIASLEGAQPLRVFVFVEYAPGGETHARRSLARVKEAALASQASRALMEVVELPEFSLPEPHHIDAYLDTVGARRHEVRIVDSLYEKLRTDPLYTFSHFLEELEQRLGGGAYDS